MVFTRGHTEEMLRLDSPRLTGSVEPARMIHQYRREAVKARSAEGVRCDA